METLQCGFQPLDVGDDANDVVIWIFHLTADAIGSQQDGLGDLNQSVHSRFQGQRIHGCGDSTVPQCRISWYCGSWLCFRCMSTRTRD